MNTSFTLEERLAALTKTYVASLPERLAEMRLYVHSYLEAEDISGKKSARQDVQGGAHKLAGSGATYGFPDISTLAAELEEYCVDSETFSVEFLTEQIDRIAAVIDEAVSSIEQDEPSIVTSSEETAGEARRKPRVVFFGSDSTSSDEVCAQLEKFNYAMEVASSLDEFSGMMAGGGVVAVIMEGKFENDTLVNGNEVSAILANQSIMPALIVLSSRDDLAARVSAVRAGCKHYLLRPMDPLALVDVLDSSGVGEDEEPCRVLIVDDDEALGQFISAILSDAGMLVDWVQMPTDLMDRVESFAPELILMDLYLPGFSGQELAAVLRQRERFASIPIVYLSGERDHGKQITAMEQGADDFLTKPVNPNHLVRRVQTRINRFRRIRARMVRDGLTNLFNHTTMRQFLGNELQRAKRYSGHLSYAIVDIDHFKSVNDSYGHGVGDVVLKTMARLLRQRLRSNDIVGRLGGEEFGVIMPDTDMEHAAQVLDQVRVAFQDLSHASDETTFHVTFSCGVAEYPGYDHPAEISEAADKALYEAKHGGRNRIVTSR